MALTGTSAYPIEWGERTSRIDGKIRVERIIGKELLGNVSGAKIASKAGMVICPQDAPELVTWIGCKVLKIW